MTLETLLTTYKNCLTNPNYQYKDLDQKEFLKLAVKSFKRLNDSQQVQVSESWAKFLGKSANALVEEEVNILINLRFLAQTNLYFLCILLEKYSDCNLTLHEPICNAFFTRKDPSYLTIRSFCEAYDGIKQRMLLIPRLTFKSSMDIADAVQWVINFPEVTLAILTGSLNLAGGFVGELKEHFLLSDSGKLGLGGKKVFVPKLLTNRSTGEQSSSAFQVIFSEHCISDPGNSREFQTAACSPIDKEPTAMAASIEQTLSGWHFYVLKMDDVVTNENSCTPTRLESVNHQISINHATLWPIGFFDVIGTWYDDLDYYGKTIDHEQNLAREQGLEGSIKGSIDSGRFESAIDTHVFLRAGWWPTKEAEESGKIPDEMKESDYELLVPELLSYKFLIAQKKKDPRGFAIKYMNNPRLINEIKFPKELLIRRTVPYTQLPQQGMTVTSVDTAYSTKDWADYTVIMTAIIYGGRFYIVDMNRGRFNEYDLPRVIAGTGFKWKPKRIVIEDSVGVKWMGRELRREMDKLKISVPVEYVGLGAGRSKTSSKTEKAKPVLRLLGDERLFFSNGCTGLEELYTELEKFGKGEARHDDIVSAISLLVNQFGAYADMEDKVSSAEFAFAETQQSKAINDIIYCTGKYLEYNASYSLEDNPTTSFQLERGAAQESITDVDPLSDLFRS